jgi:hypothetical protein
VVDRQNRTGKEKSDLPSRKRKKFFQLGAFRRNCLKKSLTNPFFKSNRQLVAKMLEKFG